MSEDTITDVVFDGTVQDLVISIVGQEALDQGHVVIGNVEALDQVMRRWHPFTTMMFLQVTRARFSNSADLGTKLRQELDAAEKGGDDWRNFVFQCAEGSISDAFWIFLLIGRALVTHHFDQESERIIGDWLEDHGGETTRAFKKALFQHEGDSPPDGQTEVQAVRETTADEHRYRKEREDRFRVELWALRDLGLSTRALNVMIRGGLQRVGQDYGFEQWAKKVLNKDKEGYYGDGRPRTWENVLFSMRGFGEKAYAELLTALKAWLDQMDEQVKVEIIQVSDRLSLKVQTGNDPCFSQVKLCAPGNETAIQPEEIRHLVGALVKAAGILVENQLLNDGGEKRHGRSSRPHRSEG